MTNQDDIPVFPITQWKLGQHPQMQALVFCPDYISHASQTLEEAHTGRFYALTLAQAIALQEDLGKHIEILKNTVPQFEKSDLN